MPPIDKEQVRMLVTAVGYKQASIQTGIPEPTLRQWSHRYNWNRQVPIPKPGPNHVTTVTKAPAQALADTLREHSAETRLGFSTTARKVAQHAARMTPTQAIRSSRGLKNITEVAEKVHGWNNQARSTSVFAQQAVVITDEEINELQARLRRLRGEE